MEFSPNTIVPLIQLAISPVILISGEGGLFADADQPHGPGG